MTENSVWIKAKSIKLQIAEGIEPGFDAGFDSKVPQEVRQELCSFMDWVEKNYPIPITLWVDFEYKHYLIDRNGKQVGYIFYWADHLTYPAFSNPDDIPEIRLPVRTEHWTIKEILCSFAEAISHYFAWICNEISDDYKVNTDDADEIVDLYLSSRKADV